MLLVEIDESMIARHPVNIGGKKGQTRQKPSIAGPASSSLSEVVRTFVGTCLSLSYSRSTPLLCHQDPWKDGRIITTRPTHK